MIVVRPENATNASDNPLLPTAGMSAGSSSYSAFYAFGVNPQSEEPSKIPMFYNLHGKIVQRLLMAGESATPLCYINIPNIRRFTANSAMSDMTAAVEEGYRRVEERIADLASIEQDEGGVEKAATDTAVQVVGYLRLKNVAPPEVTSSGDDAVVMIWKMGDMTYAISVTDGELGFVVRQARKALKMVDSIKVHSFLLTDMR